MIGGRYRGGVPVVEARIVSRFRSRPTRVLLSLDPATALTLLATGDVALPNNVALPLDDLVSVSYGFAEITALPQRVLLSFPNDDGTVHQEEVHAYIAVGPAGSSRLGADVLSHWLTVLDPGSDSVLCEPLDFEPA